MEEKEMFQLTFTSTELIELYEIYNERMRYFEEKGKSYRKEAENANKVDKQRLQKLSIAYERTSSKRRERMSEISKLIESSNDYSD